MCLSAAQQNPGIQSAQGSIRVALESLAMRAISDDKSREIKTAVAVFYENAFRASLCVNNPSEQRAYQGSRSAGLYEQSVSCS